MDAQLDTTSWGTVQADLAEAVAALADDDWLSLTTPSRLGHQPGPARPKGLRRLFVREEPVDRGILLQLRRMGVHLYVECVGARLFGGDFPWSAEEHERLLAMGWGPPPGIGARVYAVYLPAGPAPRSYPSENLADDAAGLVVRTVRDVYGLTGPAGLALSRG